MTISAGTPYVADTCSSSFRCSACFCLPVRTIGPAETLRDVALERNHGLGLRAVPLEDHRKRLLDRRQRFVNQLGPEAARQGLFPHAGQPFGKRRDGCDRRRLPCPAVPQRATPRQQWRPRWPQRARSAASEASQASVDFSHLLSIGRFAPGGADRTRPTGGSSVIKTEPALPRLPPV